MYFRVDFLDDLQNVSEQNVSERNVSEQNISIDIFGKRILLNGRKAKHRWREYVVKDMPQIGIVLYVSLIPPPQLFIMETYYQDKITMTEDSGMY